MQNQELSSDYLLCAIPKEQLKEAGLSEGDTILMHVEDNRIIIEKSPKPIQCTGDCENCPINTEDCDGFCELCPCSERCDESEVEADG